MKGKISDNLSLTGDAKVVQRGTQRPKVHFSMDRALNKVGGASELNV